MNPLDRKKKFGAVRPIVHLDNRGHKFVAVGNVVHFSKKWKTFPDFLSSYIIKTLSPDGWGKEQLKLPLSERHPILQWHHSLCDYQRRTGKDESGLYPGPTTGPGAAYVQLAYDLYVLRDNMVLQDRLVERLKNVDQFQGARHELMVAATFIRAGFEIKHEDESDGDTNHPEFAATHKATKIEVDVEAKSKRRPGVLSTPGEPNPAKEKVDVRRLLNSAMGKFRGRPFCVVLDVNLPPADGEIRKERWRQLAELVDRSKTVASKDGDRFNLISFTNFPSYWDANSNRPSDDTWLNVLSQKPLCAISHPEVLLDVANAITQVGNIPTTFE